MNTLYIYLYIYIYRPATNIPFCSPSELISWIVHASFPQHDIFSNLVTVHAGASEWKEILTSPLPNGEQK